MNINKIEKQNQYVAAGTSGTKNIGSGSSVASFQNEILNWEKRIKEAIDKQQENDNNGSILMSEKHWRNLMKKVDTAIDTLHDNNIEQEQEEKKQLEEKNLMQKDTVAVSSQTDKTNRQLN